MTLREYLKVLKTWLLPAGLVIGLLVAGAITLLTPTTYSASITLFVSAQGIQGDATRAYQGAMLSVQKVKSYTELVVGERIRAEVSDRLETKVGRDQITAFAEPETVLITATVTDRSAERAQRIADAVGVEFTALIAELEQPTDNVGAPTPVVARVVQPAQFPAEPVSPRPVWNLALGGVLGLLLGYGTALLRYALKTAPRSTDEMQHVTGAPVLGRIAYNGRLRKKPLIVHDDPRGSWAESFRQLRTNLQFLEMDCPLRTLTVTSTVPREGATTTACNLAAVLAEAGRRVVFVEADLRRPSAARYLGIEPTTGLTEVLSGDATLDQALHHCPGLRLVVLPSGPLPLNPSELLASPRMGELLGQLAARFDVVLIDAPPLLPVTDASALAAQSDGVLLVVRHGKTSKNELATGVAALDTVSARLIGTVLNMSADSGGADPFFYSSRGKGGSRIERSFDTEPRPPSDDQREPALQGPVKSNGVTAPSPEVSPAYAAARTPHDPSANGTPPPSDNTRPRPRPRL